jgi:uncharacterized protein YjbI with pentapeptide repeats
MTKDFENANIGTIQENYRTLDKFDNLKAINKKLRIIQDESWKYVYEHKNDLEGIVLTGEDLGVCSVDLSDVNFKNSFFDGVRFDNTVLKNADFRGSTFWDVSFADAWLDGADFRGATIEYHYRPMDFFEPQSWDGMLLDETTLVASGSVIDSESFGDIEKTKKILKERGAIFS